MGTSIDKRTWSWFSPDVVTDTEALNLWRGDDICRRAIEAVPEVAFRRGINIRVQDEDGGKEVAEKIQSALEDLRLVEKFVHAAKTENAFGGSAIYPVFENAADDLENELDEDKLQGKLIAFHVLEPRELWPVRWYTDINHPKFGEVEVWSLVPINSNGGIGGAGMQNIHESRLIIFKGRRISRQYQAYQRPGWGDSCLTGVYPIIRDFGSAWGHAAALIQDFAQGVLSMAGFADLMKEDGGDAVVRSRLNMLERMKSTMRMLVMDKDDTYSRQQTPMGGLSDLLHDFALRVAAACGQPVTVMFGMSPAGLNATGDNDVRGWYDTVASYREHHYVHKLEHAIRLYMKSPESATEGVEPDVWSVEFPPLWEPTEKEQAETRYIIAQTDQIYCVNIQACTPDDVAKSRWQGDTFSPEMIIDWAMRDKQAAQATELADAEHDKAIDTIKNPPPPPPVNPPPNPDGPVPGNENADQSAVEDAGQRRAA